MRTMQAAIYEQCGAARDVLRVHEVERPEPGPGEVRVRLRVSGVNTTDWKSRRGACAGRLVHPCNDIYLSVVRMN